MVLPHEVLETEIFCDVSGGCVHAPLGSVLGGAIARHAQAELRTSEKIVGAEGETEARRMARGA